MRKRNYRVEIYFTKNELETLTKKVHKSGLSREGYCRRALNDSVIKEAPPADLSKLIYEMRRIGNNLNQLLAVVHSKGFIDVPKTEQVFKDLHAAEKLIVDAYSMPER